MQTEAPFASLMMPKPCFLPRWPGARKVKAVFGDFFLQAKG